MTSITADELQELNIQNTINTGSTKGQLLWLEQPPFSNSWWFIWQEHILVEGEGAPDTFLITAAMNTTAGPIQTIITAGYFSKSLDVWWRKNESLPWKQDNVSKPLVPTSNICKLRCRHS